MASTPSSGDGTSDSGEELDFRWRVRREAYSPPPPPPSPEFLARLAAPPPYEPDDVDDDDDGEFRDVDLDSGYGSIGGGVAAYYVNNDPWQVIYEPRYVHDSVCDLLGVVLLAAVVLFLLWLACVVARMWFVGGVGMLERRAEM